MMAWVDKEAYVNLVAQFLERQIDGPAFGAAFRRLRQQDIATARAQPSHEQRSALFTTAVNRRELSSDEFIRRRAELWGFGTDIALYHLVFAVLPYADWLWMSSEPGVESNQPIDLVQEAEEVRVCIRRALADYSESEAVQQAASDRTRL